MKIKIIVIDLEIPPRVKRWALRVVIPAVVVVGAAGVAWASLPHAFTSGETLTAANLNADLQNLDGRLATLEAGRPSAATVSFDLSAGTATPTAQSPNAWIASATPAVVGQNTVLNGTFSTPFSAPPICWLNATADYYDQLATTTATTFQLVVGRACTSGCTGTALIMCVGPR
jgi:hypothetical protein